MNAVHQYLARADTADLEAASMPTLSLAAQLREIAASYRNLAASTLAIERARQGGGAPVAPTGAA